MYMYYSINEVILKTIFEPFGAVEKIQISVHALVAYIYMYMYMPVH